MADTYTGSDDELDAIVEEAWISGSPSGVLDLSRVLAWRDADATVPRPSEPVEPLGESNA